jgi:hypothetical protein
MGLLEKLGMAKSSSLTPPTRQVARMYEYDSRYYICSVRWIAEIGEPTILPHNTDARYVGEAILRHLAEFDDAEFDIRSRKKSDWPVFKASGARSIKEFEANAWHCQLSQKGTSFEVWAASLLSLKDDLSVYCSANAALPDCVGAAALNALSGAKALREQGAI